MASPPVGPRLKILNTSMIVIYESRVVNMTNLLVATTLES